MPKPIELVAGILENYANRGTFKGFSRGTVRGGIATFKILWHRDRFFDLALDTHKKTLRFPVVLPEIPAGSSMYREFKEFVESRQSESLPEHRRIDRKKAVARPSNRSGNVALTLTVKNGDYEYGARKLIHLVHEVFLVFLYDGRYYDYMVETFDLDPDHM
jgi:hypothetical protein